MGSDFPPQHLFEAALYAANTIDPSHTLVLYAQEGLSFPALSPSYCIKFCKEAILMHESPLFAVRRKRQASLSIAMQDLKEGHIDALITAGNTAAIVASASIHLTRKGSAAPALMATLPTLKGAACVLDVGACFNRATSDFVSLAEEGADFAERFLQRTLPRIGLLNIGTEVSKGDIQLKNAFAALEERFKERFAGNIESFNFFEGAVDVLVCTALMGNVFLKTTEAACHFVLKMMGDKRSVPETLHAEKYALGALTGFKERVYKVHGHASRSSLVAAIEQAIRSGL